jgi:hypothetical protein
MTGTGQTVDAMLQQVQARLDTPITDEEELKRLRKGLEGVAERSQTLSDYKLTNADEPFSVFRVHRPEVE